MNVCMCTACVPGTCERQSGALESPELTAGDCCYLGLETELGSSRSASVLNY